jgi:hypothetical protein
MADLPRWASRYQLTRELWRDKERVVLDPGLERVLGTGELETLGINDSPLADLLADLVPGEPREPPVWFLLDNARAAAEHARRKAGATFVGIRDGAELATEESWEAALVDLTGALAETDGPGALSPRLSPSLSAFIEVVAERAEEGGRVVTLSAPSRSWAGNRGVDLDDFVDFVMTAFPGARVFALSDAPMVAAYDLGIELADELEYAYGDDDDDDDADLVTLEKAPSYSELDEVPADEEDEYDADLDDAEATWSNVLASSTYSPAAERTLASHRADRPPEDARRSEPAHSAEDDVAIDYDNSLARAQPEFWGWIAIVGGQELADGVTLVELPTSTARVAPRRRSRSTDQDDAGLRAQLGRAVAEADRLAIERQRLIEELDDARERIADLEDADDGEELFARGGGEPGMAMTASEAEAYAAREQELRWRMAHLQSQVEALTTRPVTDDEIARARVEAQAAAQRVHAENEASADGDDPLAAGVEAREDAQRSRLALRRELDGLLVRLERGGATTLELHRALKRMRARYTS